MVEVSQVVARKAAVMKEGKGVEQPSGRRGCRCIKGGFGGSSNHVMEGREASD